MKTKHILTAIALPALLAACSQDEDLSGALSQKDFSNIPTVDVDFTASVNGGSQTRMATQFGWEKNDKIGLAWLGDFDSSVGGTGVLGGFDGKAYQNHPLFCTDPATQAFKTETMLYVGSYYAYMPYNEDIKSVKAVKFNVTGQELAATTAPYAKKAIYISPKLTVLTEGSAGMGKNTELNISQLSNAATVNLTFGNASKFTDLKVMGISLDVKNNGSVSILPTSFEYKPKASANVTSWDEMTSASICGNGFFGVGEMSSKGPANENLQKGAITATSKEGLAVVNNELTTYILTLPVAVAQNNATLDVIVTTNYGKIKVNLESADAAGTAKGAIVLKDKGVAEAKTIATAKIFNNFGASGSIDVYVDMKELEVPNEVATQAELNATLKTLVTMEKTGNVSITVDPKEANTAKTVDFMDFTLPEGLNCAITLTAGSNAGNGFAFKGTTVIDKQLTLASDASVNGTMTVKNVVDKENVQQAALTMDGKTLTINAGATLTNEGKMGISAASSFIVISDKDSEIAAAKYVSNASTATIDLGSGGTFTNSGEVQWIAGTLPADLDGKVYANAKDDDGIVYASAAFANAKGTNEVIISGEIAMGSSYSVMEFGNIKTMTIKGDVTLSMIGNSRYDVTKLEAINIEEGTLNFTDGDVDNPKEFTPEAGCKVKLSKGTKLNVAAGVKLNLGMNSDINYGGATVINDGIIVTSTTTVDPGERGTWDGKPITAPIEQ
ncbi:hypothetical protein AAE250_23220 [Bacteroides sp. GD17]|jgi:hypothetical protein|uniref:hypothetical protein n=1 Tax=Bacteroides sp. GD17 TaxID=3139826 RepID=UPI00313C7988